MATYGRGEDMSGAMRISLDFLKENGKPREAQLEISGYLGCDAKDGGGKKVEDCQVGRSRCTVSMGATHPIGIALPKM